jgi:DNA polymerase-1
MRPNLEADDVMGIFSTNPKYKPGAKKIIVSIDKDMQTIPGWLFNPDKDYQPWEVTKEHADRFHLAQALGGDQTDNYAGCPSIGFATAWNALETLVKPESFEHTFKSGKRQGETEIRWTKTEAEDMWDVVLANFDKQGLNEQAALLQAQVSRILRHGEYQSKKQKVVLYEP